jgi:hypothetical protein
MLTKLKVLLGGSDPKFPRPSLGDGEQILLEGTAVKSAGFFGSRGGPLILTNFLANSYYPS